MGKGIKTRVSEKKGIKAIDKAAVASERMKEAYIRTKDKADHSLYAVSYTHLPPEGAGCHPRPPYLAGRHFSCGEQVLQNL